MNIEEIYQDKQRLFALYLSLKGENSNKTGGLKMKVAKEYLKKYGTVLKKDILTQYEPSLAPDVSSEIVTIAKTVKIVKEIPKKEKSKVKKVSPRISGELVSRINGIFKYLESLERIRKQELEEIKKENEIRLKNLEIREREVESSLHLKNKQIELLTSKLKQFTNSPV